MPLLYDAVGIGMWAFTRIAFRVRELERERLRLEPGTLLVATHRRETDVPLVSAAIYVGGLVRDRSRRMAFAAREDIFTPGFLAGLPGLPTVARRALFDVEIGDVMQRSLLVFPLRSAAAARLGEVLRARPEAPLDGFPAADDFRARAAALRLPSPRRARDVVRGEYADLLWRAMRREELPDPEVEAFWAGRAAASAAEFRHLVGLVERGGVVVVFPEGYPSTTGEIGPLRRGLGALVRRGRPRLLQPIALAYDPLTRGRTRAYVALGDALDAADYSDERMLAALRAATPLTCGQVVAHELVARRAPTAEHVAEAVAEARAQRRPFDPALADPDERARRVGEAVAAAPGADVSYLAREYESARAI